MLDPKITHFHSLGTIRILLKKQNCRFYPLFDVCQQVQFQKNLINRFKEKFKNFDFG